MRLKFSPNHFALFHFKKEYRDYTPRDGVKGRNTTVSAEQSARRKSGMEKREERKEKNKRGKTETGHRKTVQAHVSILMLVTKPGNGSGKLITILLYTHIIYHFCYFNLFLVPS